MEMSSTGGDTLAVGLPSSEAHAQTDIELFGDGSDGDVTISGALSLARDMFYHNLTITTGAAINTEGWRIFCSGTLDVTAAPNRSLRGVANSGASASGSTGAGKNAQSTLNAVWGTPLGVNGANGVTGAGSAPTTPATPAVINPNQPGDGGNGGAGVSAGGASRGSPTPQNYNIGRAIYDLTYGATNLYSTGTAAPGSSGGGDGTNAGGGGGACCQGYTTVVLCARTINRGTGTAAGFIDVSQQVSGHGGNASGNAGGGGGAGGQPGGVVVLIYRYLTGASTTGGAIVLTGGQGGNGGNGSGTGMGGYAGGNGDCGVVLFYNVAARTISVTNPTAGATAPIASTSATGATAATPTAVSTDF
jgi:hypothetical protein